MVKPCFSFLTKGYSPGDEMFARFLALVNLTSARENKRLIFRGFRPLPLSAVFFDPGPRRPPEQLYLRASSPFLSVFLPRFFTVSSFSDLTGR